MAKKRLKKFKPSMFATGFWYVLTIGATSLLTALLLGIVLSNNGVPSWMFIALPIDALFVIWLIYTRKFTTSESIAWRTRAR